MSAKRFLIVKLAALGDIAHTSILLSRIRAEHPGSHVTWLCGRPGATLVELFGADEIVTVDERRLLRGGTVARAVEVWGIWSALWRRRFDRALLVHADPRYRVLTLPLRLRGIPVSMLEHGVNPLAGRFRGDECARLLDDPGPAGPITARFPYADVRERLPGTRPSRSTPRVVLVPGGARNVLRDDALRRWPVENYRDLAGRLLSEGLEVVLAGDEHDGALRPHFAGLPCIDRFGVSLIEMLTDLRDADAVVTHDTGPLQFARLTRTPTVALFGPTEPRHAIGDAADVDVLWGGAHLACRPCYDGRNFANCTNNLCIQDVTVGAVAARVLGRAAKPVAP